VSDTWPGLDDFFEPGRELLIAENSGDVVDALSKNPEELRSVGRSARKRVLSAHTAQHRSDELVDLLESVA
jgi:spore maturation protein CgeB